MKNTIIDNCQITVTEKNEAEMKVSHTIGDPISIRPVLTLQQTAELYHVGEQRIRDWVSMRPDYKWYFKNGKQVLIWNEKFKTWLQEFRDVYEIS